MTYRNRWNQRDIHTTSLIGFERPETRVTVESLSIPAFTGHLQFWFRLVHYLLSHMDSSPHAAPPLPPHRKDIALAGQAAERVGRGLPVHIADFGLCVDRWRTQWAEVLAHTFRFHACPLSMSGIHLSYFRRLLIHYSRSTWQPPLGVLGNFHPQKPIDKNES